VLLEIKNVHKFKENWRNSSYTKPVVPKLWAMAQY